MEDYKCLLCKAPIKDKYGLCKACQIKGGKERDAYIKYIKEKEQNEA